MTSLIWQFLSYFGDIQYWLGLTVAILIIYQILDKQDKKRMAWIVFALLPAIIISSQLTFSIQNIFQVPRPCAGLVDCPGEFSFPSAHATLIFAFATVVSLNTMKYKIYLFVFPLAVLVALSRVFLNYHTYPDIIVGALIGIFSGYLTYLSYKTIPSLFKETKRKRHLR